MIRVIKNVKQTVGVIEWKSHTYPDKHYVAQCFSPDMYVCVWMLVNAISDYHTVVYHTYLKH